MTEDWRDNKTASACLEHLYLSDKMADVHFVFPSTDNRHERPLPAHRFVLALRSPVFETMFYGSLPESGDKIKIEDISRQVFQILLRFLYTDSVDLDGDVVLHCLYAAKKYQVSGLVRQCEKFLKQAVSAENVCTILEQARFYDAMDVHKDCMDFICSNPLAVIEQESFQALSLQSVVELLSYHEFATEEIDIFKAVLAWANEQCTSKGMELTPGNLRETLCDVLFEIRFPLMSIEDFKEYVVPVGILTADEQLELLNFFDKTVKSKGPSVGGFKATQRQSMPFDLILKYENEKEMSFNEIQVVSQLTIDITSDSNILVKSWELASPDMSCLSITIDSRDIPFEQEGATLDFVKDVPLLGSTKHCFSFTLSFSFRAYADQFNFDQECNGVRLFGTANAKYIRSITIRKGGV